MLYWNSYKFLFMNERQKQILKTIVEMYAQSSQAVGSVQVVEMVSFPVSSATVRADMAELTNAGYLVQPHTSAGRIPTDKGYKIYVEALVGTL